MPQLKIKTGQSTIAEEPSGWHVGFDKRELTVELTRRMGWKLSSYGVEAIYSHPMNTEQIADVLGALDLRDAEIRRLRKLLPYSDEQAAVYATRGNCLHCGFNPCRRNEVNAVADGLQQREGVTIKD